MKLSTGLVVFGAALLSVAGGTGVLLLAGLSACITGMGCSGSIDSWLHAAGLGVGLGATLLLSGTFAKAVGAARRWWRAQKAGWPEHRGVADPGP